MAIFGDVQYGIYADMVGGWLGGWGLKMLKYTDVV